MKQYDATSLPNPQIKHAKNVEFPLNDKDSYFNLKILRQKEIFIACLYIFSFFCNYVSLFWKYAQIWRIIRESANTRLTKMFEAIFRSLKVSTSFDTLLWPLSWQGQLKKNILFYNYSYILYFECLLFSSELSVLITFIIVFSRRIHCCGGGGEGGPLWEAT